MTAGHFDPTPADLDAARRRLAQVDDADLTRTAFAQLAGRLDGLADGTADVDEVIRGMRAALTAHDERKAAKA